MKSFHSPGRRHSAFQRRPTASGEQRDTERRHRAAAAPSLISRAESLERCTTADFLNGDHDGPTPAALGFRDDDLAAWRVPRDAAEAFIRGWLSGVPFDKLVWGRQPRVESLPFAYELAQRVSEWRGGRRAW